MRIRVNDRDVEFNRSTVQDLIVDLRLDANGIIVEKNGVIVNRDGYKDEELREGDVLEILRFVGGG